MKLQNYEIICRKIIRNKYLWRYRYRYKNYVDWLRKEIPTRENLQEYIEETLKFDRNLIVGISDVDLNSSIGYISSISFPGAYQYKKILDEAKKLQNELKAENQNLE